YFPASRLSVKRRQENRRLTTPFSMESGRDDFTLGLPRAGPSGKPQPGVKNHKKEHKYKSDSTTAFGRPVDDPLRRVLLLLRKPEPAAEHLHSQIKNHHWHRQRSWRVRLECAGTRSQPKRRLGAGTPSHW